MQLSCLDFFKLNVSMYYIELTLNNVYLLKPSSGCKVM
jgi:hypothetical protein